MQLSIQLAQKNERPVGVPAALAWGDGGYLAGRSVTRLRGSRSFDCARKQQNNAQEQDHNNHPPTRCRTLLPTTATILPPARASVSRPKDSIKPVLRSRTKGTVPQVLR